MSFLFITFFWFTFLPFDQDLSLEALLIWVRCFLFQQPYVLWYQEGVSLGVVSHVGGKVHRLKACGGHIRITRRVEWDFLGISYFFKDFINLFLERGERREKERERNINVWLPLVHHLLGTWPTSQACALTGSWTDDPLVHRLALNPLSHTSQGWFFVLNEKTAVSLRGLWRRHSP